MDFFGIGSWEVLVIAILALVILGPKQMIIMARKAGELLRRLQREWERTYGTLEREMKDIETDVTTPTSKSSAVAKPQSQYPAWTDKPED
ncbi:MAG: twin-arginine translocase TatA/TatE family subunit [Chloroflexota bacterium]